MAPIPGFAELCGHFVPDKILISSFFWGDLALANFPTYRPSEAFPYTPSRIEPLVYTPVVLEKGKRQDVSVYRTLKCKRPMESLASLARLSNTPRFAR